MRLTQLTLASCAALALSTGAAFAVDVNKKIEAPGQVLVVWTLASDFCSIKDWHPAVAKCEQSKEGSDTFRTLTLKDGGVIKEKLTGSDDTSYSYEIIESPLPVKNYSAKLWVEEDERDPNRTVIHWDASFDANGKSDEEAKKIISDIFTAGLKGIKQKAMPPEGQE
jgi:Polyketide cyclase / dehydrase and lipid transport